tara:strand:- start:307 stop:525 length:219 start_codon:yes stop_codon:yes gene_type:complete
MAVNKRAFFETSWHAKSSTFVILEYDVFEQSFAEIVSSSFLFFSLVSPMGIQGGVHPKFFLHRHHVGGRQDS